MRAKYICLMLWQECKDTNSKDINHEAKDLHAQKEKIIEALPTENVKKKVVDNK